MELNDFIKKVVESPSVPGLAMDYLVVRLCIDDSNKVCVAEGTYPSCGEVKISLTKEGE